MMNLWDGWTSILCKGLDGVEKVISLSTDGNLFILKEIRGGVGGREKERKGERKKSFLIIYWIIYIKYQPQNSTY